MLLTVLTAPSANAYDLSAFDESVSELRESMDDQALREMENMGISGPEDVGQPDILDAAAYFAGQLSAAASGPLAALALSIGALLLFSAAQGYTASLRHTDMKEISSMVTTLFLTGTVVSPLHDVLQRSVDVIGQVSSVMLLYLPLAIGILLFSGQVISAGGYYTTMMTAAQLIASLSAGLLSGLLQVFLAVSVCAGIGNRVRIKGFCDMINSLLKWILTFLMGIYTAVLSLQTALAGTADTLANRAARLTLSSLIPLVGSAVSEAYKTLQSSVNLLRSGIGIFVIIGTAVTILPVLLQTVLWQLTLHACKWTAYALSVDSGAALFDALSKVTSILIAILISVLTVYLISTAAMLSIGGAA